MRATVIYGAGDVRVESVPDPALREPTDALVRVVNACICGSDLGVEFGATDVVAERGEEGAERVRELSGGGTHTVLECVGLVEAIETAFAVVRDGGTVSRVGAPQYDDVPMPFGVFMRNVTLTGGVAPARAYIAELLPDVLKGRIEPGKVFDLAVGLEDVAHGYKAMADRTALKVLVRP